MMKIGDRVRLAIDEYEELRKGAEGVIAYVAEPDSVCGKLWPYEVAFDYVTGGPWLCKKDEIELVGEENL